MCKPCLSTRSASVVLLGSLLVTSAFGQGSSSPSVRILLPERPRLLQGQQVDLVLEVRNASAVSGLSVKAGDVDLTSHFAAPQQAQLDCDTSSDWVIRANLQSFETAGTVKLTANLSADGSQVSDS